MLCRYICALAWLFLVCACAQGVDYDEVTTPAEAVPICFASTTVDGVEVTTRADGASVPLTTRGETPLKRDFQLYGFKTSETYYQTVFNNYTVAYSPTASGGSDDSSDYYYVDAAENQTIKFWDMSARRYQFFALSPAQEVSGTDLNGTNTMTTTLDLTDLTDPPLYTRVQTVEEASYGQVVRMEFLRPAVQVAYRFVMTDGIAPNTVKIDRSSFAPEDGDRDKIYVDGTATLTYASTGVSLAFAGGTVFSETVDDVTYENQFTTPQNYYTVLPTGPDGVGPFKLVANVTGTEKTATVPAAYMQWQPGYKYTYIFKIQDASLTIVLADVVVDDWGYGGYVQDNQYQW